MDWSFILQVANAQAILSAVYIDSMSVDSNVSDEFVSCYIFPMDNLSAYLCLLWTESCAMAKLSVCDRLLHYVYHSIGRLYVDRVLLLIRTLGRSILQYILFKYFNLYSFLKRKRIPVHGFPSNPVLGYALGEGLCLMGTVFTGIFGLIGCCRGFGRLFYAQEKMMLVCKI
ncbi:unnamed protein product [Onchocerca flexuosa]|uniref:Transmembrane protein n=1 Tax=Onchocerca flexuosa TaxID=387005 RepID=A0A183I7T7_9BILA|nr:unnamed protein product [Onchocerca flexuosa]